MIDQARMQPRETSDIWSDFISREDLATELGVKPETLAKWAAQGAGPDMVKMGRRVFYPRDAVRSWLGTRVVKKASPS